jgi:hypothetical protein
VLRAVHERPREYWLGFSAVKAIVGQMVAPGVADRLLAREGKGNETTNQPAEAGRPDNLFEAGRGDPGTHGRFDQRSRGHAVPFDPAVLRTVAGAALLALVGGLALQAVAERRSTARKRGRRATEARLTRRADLARMPTD